MVDTSLNTASLINEAGQEANSSIITYPLDKYEIKIRVGKNGEFIGVEEIKINKNFIDYKQQSSNKGYHDVSEYYSE